MQVIGYLSSYSPDPSQQWIVAAFRQGLNDAGYVEGRNIAIEYRWAEGRYDRLPALAADLIARKVALIVAAGGPPPALVAKSASSTVPIVFVNGSDPVADGLVASFAHPGVNITGITFMTAEMTAKRFELLSELVPRAKTIALLVNPGNPNTERTIRDMQEAAHAKGVQLEILKGTSETEVDAAFAYLVQRHAGALMVAAEPAFSLPNDRSWCSRHGMRFPRSIIIAWRWRAAPCSAMDRVSQPPIAWAAFTPDGFSRGLSPPIFQFGSPLIVAGAPGRYSPRQ